MCWQCAYLPQLSTVSVAQQGVLCLEQPWAHHKNFSHYPRVWLFSWPFYFVPGRRLSDVGDQGNAWIAAKGWVMSQFLFCQNGQALVKASPGQRVSILGDAQNLSRHSSIWPSSEQRVWTRQSEEVLHQQFCDSAKRSTTAIPKRATASWSALWSRGLLLSLLPGRENIWWSRMEEEPQHCTQCCWRLLTVITQTTVIFCREMRFFKQFRIWLWLKATGRKFFPPLW